MAARSVVSPRTALCTQPTAACACVQPVTVCLPGEWPRVVALLDDLGDWEVLLSWLGLGSLTLTLTLTLIFTPTLTLTLTLNLTRFVTTTYDALCGNFVLHLRRLRLTNYLLVTFDASQQERLLSRGEEYYPNPPSIPNPSPTPNPNPNRSGY